MSVTTGRLPRGRKLPEVESLRGVAIALVVLFHLDAMATGRSFDAPVATSLLGAFVLGGHTGVSLFFVLSGFLLTRPFLVEAAGGRPVSRGAYLARRALRILPLWVTMVAIASVDCARRPADLLAGVPYLFFLNAVPALVRSLTPYSEVWWSLATEVEFYLLLPCLPWLGRRLGAAVAIVWALAYGALVTGALPTSPAGAIALLNSVVGRAPLFALGAAAALVLPALTERIHAWVTPHPARRWAFDVLLLAVLVALGLLLQRVVAVSYLAAELRAPWWHVPEGLLWTGVLLLLLATPLRSKALFSNPILGVLGLWSYSLYMIHFPVIWNAFNPRLGTIRPLLDAWALPAAARPPVVLAACVALAALSYVVVERPFLRLKESDPRIRREQAVPPPSR